MSIILISPYGSNDLLIRFTHSAVRQFEETSFVAQMNAARCIGGQNKRIIISITSVNKNIEPNKNHKLLNQNLSLWQITKLLRLWKVSRAN